MIMGRWHALCQMLQLMMEAEAAAEVAAEAEIIPLSPCLEALPCPARALRPERPYKGPLLPRAPGAQARAPDSLSKALHQSAKALGLLTAVKTMHRDLGG